MRIIIIRKENDKMEFIKGTIIGMVAGTCLGVIKNEMFCDIIKQGKRKFRKMQKKISFQNIRFKSKNLLLNFLCKINHFLTFQYLLLDI